MTRINLLHPEQLSDKHLMAEYRELPRIFTAVRKLIAQGKTPADIDIPSSYVLGTGHVKFFYNKCIWLYDRFERLASELRRRGVRIDEDTYQLICNDARTGITGEWIGSIMWCPTPEETYLNMARVCRRSKMPHVQAELESDA